MCPGGLILLPRDLLVRGVAAVALNDTKSWRRAVGFVKTLTLERSDVFPFALSGATVGGVRCTLSRSSIRIDQVRHALHALVEGQQLLS